MAPGNVLERTERVGAEPGEGDVKLADGPAVCGEDALHGEPTADVLRTLGPWRTLGDELEREEVDAALVADRGALWDRLDVGHADEQRARIHACHLGMRRALELDHDLAGAIELVPRHDDGAGGAVVVVLEAHADARAGLDG